MLSVCDDTTKSGLHVHAHVSTSCFVMDIDSSSQVLVSSRATAWLPCLHSAWTFLCSMRSTHPCCDRPSALSLVAACMFPSKTSRHVTVPYHYSGTTTTRLRLSTPGPLCCERWLPVKQELDATQGLVILLLSKTAFAWPVFCCTSTVTLGTVRW